MKIRMPGSLGAHDDDTVVLPKPAPVAPRRQPRPRTPRRWILLALCAGLATAGAATLLAFRAPHTAAPAAMLPVATAAEIEADTPDTLHWFRFAQNPRILVADFPTLASQAQMFDRVAVFAEMAGAPHNRIVSEAELTQLIAAAGEQPDTYYYGHDYDSATIRRFFATADRDGVTLNPAEQTLRGVVTGQGFLRKGADQAVITLPRLGADPQVDAAFRHAVLTHELSHGEFFTDPAYAAYARAFWTTVMTEQERNDFRAFLARGHYDTALTTLMVNETQAYLMFTPDPRLTSAAAFGVSPDALAALRERYRAGLPVNWLRGIAVPQ